MKLTEVSRKYDRAARHYDAFTDVLFGRILGLEKYRSQTIDLLGDLDGATVLDVGCGTGRNFPLLVERVGEQGRIIGVDYSERMLDKARQRVRAHGWQNIELIRGDAARLEAVSAPVDAVVAMWCYGIVFDLEAALNRAVDLLGPDGRICILDFGKSRPDHGLLRLLFPLYSFALQRVGIDSAEDLDDAKLRAKWAHGRQILKSRLGALHEKNYLHGVGLILVGQKAL